MGEMKAWRPNAELKVYIILLIRRYKVIEKQLEDKDYEKIAH